MDRTPSSVLAAQLCAITMREVSAFKDTMPPLPSSIQGVVIEALSSPNGDRFKAYLDATSSYHAARCLAPRPSGAWPEEMRQFWWSVTNVLHAQSRRFRPQASACEFSGKNLKDLVEAALQRIGPFKKRKGLESGEYIYSGESSDFGFVVRAHYRGRQSSSPSSVIIAARERMLKDPSLTSIEDVIGLPSLHNWDLAYRLSVEEIQAGFEWAIRMSREVEQSVQSCLSLPESKEEPNQ